MPLSFITAIWNKKRTGVSPSFTIHALPKQYNNNYAQFFAQAVREAASMSLWYEIKDYSMIVATRPEPTVLPPSRSDLVIFRNLFVTVFAVLWLILWVFYLLFYLFPGEMLQIRITDFGKNLVYHAFLSVPERHHFRPPWRYCNMDAPECKLILCEIRSTFVD